MNNNEINAAVLIIGDEILSGRTKDTNSNTIALFLQPFGIRLREIRVVGDNETQIIENLNYLRTNHRYVFTSGGIGPTHDDITADCVAKAFGVKIDIRQDAVEMLKKRYLESDLNESRLRMARIPDSASLINNPVSFAPGFQIENVFVMAGVPNIMKAMLEEIAPRLERGAVLYSKTLKGDNLREGDFAPNLRNIANAFPNASIGSYPWFNDAGFGTRIVVRSTDKEVVESCIAALIIEIEKLGIEPKLVD